MPGYRSSVIHQIYDVMRRSPHAVALTDGDLVWTYDDLRRKSDLVARTLARNGILRGSVVGMHLPRCADAIAAMLGIMASGCVYLPLDPAYPSARLRSMLDLAGAVAVISRASPPGLCGPNRTWLPSPSDVAQPETPGGDLAEYSAETASFGPEDCAYILFTSGSTGEPKGVMVTHENITLMNTWSADLLNVTSSDSSATTCSLSFDPSFHETLLPLSRGGVVHVIPHAMALGQLTRRVSFFATTPTIANELLRSDSLPSLRVLMLGGEPLVPDIAERLVSCGRVGTLLNCYGPTECTVCVTVAEVAAPVPGIIPIGRPVPGTNVLILNEKGQEVPDGALGEICSFGGQVTPGYVNNAAETAERFKLGPLNAPEPQRYYRTGDLGYRSPDGLIYFAGRADKQVKVNGIRIELGEIEAALRSHPEILDAAVVARSDGRPVAYAVPAQAGAEVDVRDLRKHLSQGLPRFMLPVAIVVVTELPRTVNGKLDGAALPASSPVRAQSEADAAGRPDKETALVAKIVADVTGFAGPVRPPDDLMSDLGGTSLDVIRVVIELQRYYEKKIHIDDAFADTSVAGLARLVREDTPPSPFNFVFHADGKAPPVFLIPAYLGGMKGLRRIAELLPPGQPVYGLHVYHSADQPETDVSMAGLAQNALNRIRQVQSSGEIALVGHSAGGLIVFEAARKIVEAGGPEPRMLLLDTPLPHSIIEYEFGEFLLYWRDSFRDPARTLRGAVKRLFRAARPARGAPDTESPADDLMALAERQSRSIDGAIRSYRPRNYPGSITLMRTRQGRAMALGRRYLGWSGVARGRLRVIDVPGTHLTILQPPHLVTAADRLTGWLANDRST